MTAAITITDLSLRIGDTPILFDVSFSLQKGEITGLIGRSGSGKSMTALTMMGLAPQSAMISGEIKLDDDRNILSMTEQTLCDLRGNGIGMIFQEPLTALNPLQSIGAQVAETFIIHKKVDRTTALEKAKTVLARVGLPENEIPASRFPHELSGGQRQRVVIAIAIALRPRILIADEPTTALDVTTQAEILSLLRTLAREDGSTLLLITHDLSAVSKIADHILIMKDGRIVYNETADNFYAHASSDIAGEFIPARVVRSARQETRSENALTVEALSCDYQNPRRSFFATPTKFRAVDNVTFSVAKGENLGLVGESGCGKSTLAKALLGLHTIAEGAVSIGGENFPAPDRSAMRRLRSKIQIVFQDPYSSFNPRKRIADIVSEPLHLVDASMSKRKKLECAATLIEQVGLKASALEKYPHAFSGGQRQRIAIARALATEPDIIILDEATSALDIASRNHVLSLLQSLSVARNVSLVFITHDLSVVRDIADRVIVMKAGRIVESGKTVDIFENPQKAYTKRLIAATPAIRWRNRECADGDADA